jgi:hypothetical protein
LTRILNKKNIVGISPEFVDPEYLYMTVNTNFFYDPSKTTQATANLESNIRATIVSLRDSELDNFDAVFRKSKFSRDIDYTNKSILNSNTEINLYKILKINTENPANYRIEFVNPIRKISSTSFRLFNNSVDYYLDDDGNGNIRRFHFENSRKIIDSANFGSVNYSTGRIDIPTVALSLLTDNCKIFAEPVSQDIHSVRNQILTILDTDITVTGNIDTRKSLIR